MIVVDVVVVVVDVYVVISAIPPVSHEIDLGRFVPNVALDELTRIVICYVHLRNIRYNCLIGLKRIASVESNSGVLQSTRRTRK